MTERVDELVPDRKARMEVGGVSAMTIHRWDNSKLGFPPKIKLNGRNYRSRHQLEAFKAALMARALKARQVKKKY